MKNNLIIFVLAITTCIANTALAVRQEITSCTGAVQGDCVFGTVSIGSAGDRLSFDTQALLIQNLGTIKTTKNAELTLSLTGQKLVAFTPTLGDLANKQIKLLFYAFDINNMPKGLSNQKIYTEATDAKIKHPWAQTILKIYRQLPGEQQWTELLTSFNDKPLATIEPSITVDSSAKFTYYPQQYPDFTGKMVTPTPIVFDLSKAP